MTKADPGNLWYCNGCSEWRCLIVRPSASDLTVLKLFSAYTHRGIAKDNAVKLIAASLGISKKEVLDIVYRVKGHV